MLIPIKSNCCCNARHPANQGDCQGYVRDKPSSLHKIIACLSRHEAGLILTKGQVLTPFMCSRCRLGFLRTTDKAGPHGNLPHASGYDMR